MIEKGMTVENATHRWVAEFNRFPQDMIEKLMSIDNESWREVTRPAEGTSVYLYNIPDEDSDGNYYDGSDCEGEIVEVLDNGGCYLVELNDGTIVRADSDELEIQTDGFLPMWGTMWQFGDSCDEYWLSEKDGIQCMSGCGFRIYEHDEWGYFFGIDGAGYNFYEAHWIPAYRKRGLEWHDERTEHTEEEVKKMVEAIGISSESNTKILELSVGKSVCIGGYYGGYITADQMKALEMTGHFNADARHEMVQEMSHTEKNDYYVITREV